MPNPRKCSSSGRAIFYSSVAAAWTCCAALALLCAPVAQAGKDSAPDWLRAAAADKVPDYPHPPGQPPDVVMLLNEEQITVHDNGEIETRARQAFRVLRAEAQTSEEWNFKAVSFDKDTKVSGLRSWTITPDGRELATDKADIGQIADFGQGPDIEFNDAELQTLRYLEVKPGSVIGVEYVQKQRPYIFEEDWLFQGMAPVRTSRVTLRIPSGWEFSARFLNLPDQKPVSHSAGEYVWELHDIPAIQQEPDMPPWASVAQWMGLKYFPRDPKLRAKSIGSWQDIGLWYNGLTRGRRDASPQIKQEVAALTSGKADTLAKIRALADYMSKIRYFAIELGIGGFQPHSAAEIFAHQYGDCKDKVTLLSSMLSLIGVESYYTMVDTQRGVVREDYPSIEGNHVIIAIRLPADVPETTLFATLNDPKLGRLLFFDPTNRYVPLGYLPSYLQMRTENTMWLSFLAFTYVVIEGF